MTNEKEKYGKWVKGKRILWLSEEEVKALEYNEEFRKIIDYSEASAQEADACFN
jgi:hypothetical protein